MSKKNLIIIIAVLAVILVAGVITAFVLPGATSDGQGDQLSTLDSTPADVEETDAAVQETNADGEVVETDVPTNADGEQVTTDQPGSNTQGSDNNDSTSETKGQTTSKDPTSPTKGNTSSNDPTTPTQEPTTPTATEPEVTEPEAPYFPEATGTPAPDKDEVTYLEYHSMSAAEQKAFINTFESYDAFFEWHDAAKKAYEDSMIEIDGSTPVDVEDILGGN